MPAPAPTRMAALIRVVGSKVLATNRPGARIKRGGRRKALFATILATAP